MPFFTLSLNLVRENQRVGHIFCTCGGRMSGKPMHGGKWKYYVCNQKLNRRHLRDCYGKAVNLKYIDPVVWGWIANLLSVEQKQLQKRIGKDLITDEQIEMIKAMAAQLRSKLKDLTSETKRRLLNILNVRVQLTTRNNEQCPIIQCS